MFFYAFTTFLYVIGNAEYAMSASLMMLVYRNHFGNTSGVTVEPTNPKPGDRGETGGVDGFEAKENEWGEIAFTPWED